MFHWAIRLLALFVLITSLTACDRKTAAPGAASNKPESLGRALWFDGQDDIARTPKWLSGRPEGWCIEAWLRPAEMNPYGAFATVFAHRANGHDKFLRYEHAKSVFSFAAAQPSGAAIFLSSEGKARTGAGWSHVAVVGDKDRVHLYVDGVEVAMTSKTVTLDWDTAHAGSAIGGDPLPGGMVAGKYRGFIDEVRVWNQARSADDIRKTMKSSVPADSPGLAACWNFDEAGGMVAQDASGRGKYFQLAGDNSQAQPMRVASDCPVDHPRAPGPARYALWFNGIDSRVRCASIRSMKDLPAFACEMWIRPSAPLTRACLISCERSPSQREFHLVLEPDGALSGVVRVTQGPWKFQSSGPVIKPNVWQHVAIVVGAKLVILVDHKPVFEKDFQRTAFSAAPITVGSASDGTLPFAGDMDEVRFWRGEGVDPLKAAVGKPAPPDAAGLLACWRMDEPAGQILIDRSPSAAHAQLGDMMLPEGAEPIRMISTAPVQEAPPDKPRKPVLQGFALRFDGVDDYVDAGNAPDLSLTKAITVEAWINLDAADFEQPIVAKENVGGGQNAYELLLVNSKPRFRVSDGTAGCCGDPGWSPAEGRTAVAPKSWHHIAGTYDGKQVNVYLDGVLDGTLAFQKPIYTVPFTLKIGTNALNQRKVFRGQIDEVRLWNRARTQQEILGDMNRSLRGNEQGLIGYWTFDDPAIEDAAASGTLQVALDHSAFNHHGSLGGDLKADPMEPKWMLSDAPIAPAK